MGRPLLNHTYIVTFLQSTKHAFSSIDNVDFTVIITFASKGGTTMIFGEEDAAAMTGINTTMFAISHVSTNLTSLSQFLV